MVEAILTEGGRFCAEVIQPTNQTGDREGCTRNADGSVTTPSGFKQAYDQLVAGGWTALSGPEAYGGPALPPVVSPAFQEYLISANPSFAVYPGLTAGGNGANHGARQTRGGGREEAICVNHGGGLINNKKKTQQ